MAAERPRDLGEQPLEFIRQIAFTGRDFAGRLRVRTHQACSAGRLPGTSSVEATRPQFHPLESLNLPSPAARSPFSRSHAKSAYSPQTPIFDIY